MNCLISSMDEWIPAASGFICTHLYRDRSAPASDKWKSLEGFGYCSSKKSYTTSQSIYLKDVTMLKALLLFSKGCIWNPPHTDFSGTKTYAGMNRRRESFDGQDIESKTKSRSTLILTTIVKAAPQRDRQACSHGRKFPQGENHQNDSTRLLFQQQVGTSCQNFLHLPS